MAHKKFSKWLFNGRLFVQFKVANELWYFSRKDEVQMHLFFVGWYERPNGLAKLFSITFLNLSFQFGFASPNAKEDFEPK